MPQDILGIRDITFLRAFLCHGHGGFHHGQSLARPDDQQVVAHVVAVGKRQLNRSARLHGKLNFVKLKPRECRDVNFLNSSLAPGDNPDRHQEGQKKNSPDFKHFLQIYSCGGHSKACHAANLWFAALCSWLERITFFLENIFGESSVIFSEYFFSLFEGDVSIHHFSDFGGIGS